MSSFGEDESFGPGHGIKPSRGDGAVIKSCQDLVRDYMRTSSAEFSIFKDELGLGRSSGSRMIQIAGLEKLGLSASHSRDQRNLFSVLISKIDEMSNDSEIFDSLLESLVEIERIWCLCEIFQFNQQGKLLSLDFARWLYETGRKDTAATMNFFAALEKPEFHTGNNMNLEGGGSVDGYWQSIYTFAIQGSLDAVWDLLCLHSEFPRINASRNVHSNWSNDHDGNEFALELQAIFSSHPYLSSVVRDDVSAIDAPSSSSLSRDLMIWIERVQRLRQSSSAFLGRIPQLLKLMDILAGSEDGLKEVGKEDWLLLTLGKLLYTFSPPLSRTNLEKILEQSIASTKSSSSFGSSAKTEMQQNTVRSIIGGEVGIAIRHIYESRKSAESIISSSFEFMNILFLAPSILLCYLLIHGCEIIDLNEPLESHNPHSGYFDRLIVRMAQELSRFKFPLTVIMNIVNTPSDPLAVDLSLKVLPTVPVDSDDEARQLAEAIRGQAKTITNIISAVKRELFRKANDVLIARGLFWLGKGEERPERRREYAKAISFFSAADDMTRSTGIVDLMTRRVIEAVVRSPHFTAFPVKMSSHEHSDNDLDALLAETRAVLSNFSHATYLTPFIKGLSGLHEITKHSQPTEANIKGLENALHTLSTPACGGQMPKRYVMFLLATIVFANDMYLEACTALKRGHSSRVESALPKATIYNLIAQLELHMISFDAERCTDNLVSSSMWGQTDLTALRRKLLAMLSNSCLAENASFRHTRVGREVANGSSDDLDYGKSSSAPVTSTDLLGGIALY